MTSQLDIGPKAALITIDVQKFFCQKVTPLWMSKFSPLQRSYDRAVRNINDISPIFRNAGGAVIHVRTFVLPENLFEFYKLDVREGDIEVVKKWSTAFNEIVDGYTRHSSDLEDVLVGKGIETLFFAGFTLGACVARTALSAVGRRYKTKVLSECVANDDGTDCSEELSKLSKASVYPVSMDLLRS
jgi:nicotinamidase-related amidase